MGRRLRWGGVQSSGRPESAEWVEPEERVEPVPGQKCGHQRLLRAKVWSSVFTYGKSLVIFVNWGQMCGQLRLLRAEGG